MAHPSATSAACLALVVATCLAGREPAARAADAALDPLAASAPSASPGGTASPSPSPLLAPSSAAFETPPPPPPDEPGSPFAPAAQDAEPRVPWRHRTRARRLDEVPWPGTFIGARLGMSAGQALVPKYGFGADSTAIDTVGQFAPYLGTELFYSASKKWGGGVTFEGSFIDLTSSSAWSGSTRHLLAGLEVCYTPNRKLRWIFAFNPYSSYKFSFPSGQNLNSRGVGIRAGAHLLLGKPADSHAWEAFGYLSLDRFVNVEAGTNGQTRSYSTFDFVGNDNYTGMRLLMVGIQYNFAY